MCFLLLTKSTTGVTSNMKVDHNCSMNNHLILGGIGGVLDLSSRVGKDQKIAMELAVQDFYISTCYNLPIYLSDLRGNSGHTASQVMKLVEEKQVQAIMGILTLEEASLVSGFNNGTTVISLAPTAISPLQSAVPPLFIHMSHDIRIHVKCIAALVGHFRWRKLTTIYEQRNTFSTETDFMITELSESLQYVDSTIEHHYTFPPISSLDNPTTFISNELVKLKSLNNRVFVILKSSLQFATLLFERANQMGMMGNGYVWIISDDISSLLDSIGQPVISNMQGVIGFKSNFVDTGDSFEAFKLRFRVKYISEYPEEEHLNPSINALRAYDATWMIAKAMSTSEGRNKSKILFENILSSNFIGLSGKISFNNGNLKESPTFQVMNVIGKSYREIAIWSPEFGFSVNSKEGEGRKMRIGNELAGELGSVYWPGGAQSVPRGWRLGNKEKPMKIGVPARGAFNQFVNVRYDQNHNEMNVAGFSIEVFEAAVRQLAYNFSYVFVPYYGSYDEMVADVYNQSLDAAVGDTEIMADRYKIAEFSQPYMESGLVMVVTVRPDSTNESFMFLRAFTMKMWLLMAVMSLYTGFVVWLTENVESNPDFESSSVYHHVGKMLWFSVTVLSFAQRESIKSNLSRFVLATWLFVVVVVTVCFTASLTSIITVQRIQASPVSIEYLQRTNAAVGCNGNSFIVQYLINVLDFKAENIKKINSIKDYPEAFEKGEIQAAYFVAPHAKVFLAKYCQGYTTAGPSYKLGGFGFVFRKGSPLVNDISEAILKVSESGKILELEKHMLSFSNCNSSSIGISSGDTSLGPEPFSGLLIISGCISAAAFLISIARLLTMRPLILRFALGTLLRRRVGRWTSSILSRRSDTTFTSQSSERADNTTPEMQQNSIAIELAASNQTLDINNVQQQSV
ncbi:glutamate receptor 2.7-like [Apium graveolens]|uniref:glutamate receptor 2.7-like n=1 Tax=Apium graveolens TaxID=4045 RepID=UPI003D79D512